MFSEELLENAQRRDALSEDRNKVSKEREELAKERAAFAKELLDAAKETGIIIVSLNMNHNFIFWGFVLFLF